MRLARGHTRGDIREGTYARAFFGFSFGWNVSIKVLIKIYYKMVNELRNFEKIASQYYAIFQIASQFAICEALIQTLYYGHNYNVTSYNFYFDCDLQQVLLIVDTRFSPEAYFVSSAGIDLVYQEIDLISEEIHLISEEVYSLSEEVYSLSEEVYSLSEEEQVDFHTICKTYYNSHC